MDIAGNIFRILHEKESKLNRLGDLYSEKILIPFCWKYGLKYYSGNGTFFFEDVKTGFGFTYAMDEYTVGMDELIDKHGEEFVNQLEEIECVLGQELEHDNYFGYYCYDPTTSRTDTGV